MDYECSITQWLESAALALDGRNGDFIRPDSLLVVVMITDREDCSTADDALWAAGPWQQQYFPNARCYKPPDGLMHPIERYVEIFSRIHPAGRTIVAVVGRYEAPVFVGDKASDPVYAQPLCQSRLQPTLRLGRFVDAIQALNQPNLEARMWDGCSSIFEHDYSEFDKLAERIAELALGK